MVFTYKKKQHKFPTSLCEIKLQQRIDFDRLYAAQIKAHTDQVYKFDENKNPLPADEVEVMQLNIDIAVKNFSFFTGIPLDEVQKQIPIETILNIYYSCFRVLFEEQDAIQLEEDYYWNNELWKIEKPELTYQSSMTFNELITSKQIVKQMHDLGAGHWESMPYLAAVFLKREGEAFDESWLAPDSDRVKMMHNLPMDIAIAIGFFLRVSTSIYQTTLQYSQAETEAKKDPI